MQSQGTSIQQLKGGMELFAVSTVKKTERLATAMYLVTNFLSDTEPLKTHLRELSVALIREASNVRYGARGTEFRVLENLQTNIGETLMLLELAFVAGSVSEMNFSILKREYRALHGIVEVKKASKESGADTILGDSFFGPPFGEDRQIHPRAHYESNLPRVASSSSAQERFLGGKTPRQGHHIGHIENKMSFNMSDTNGNEKKENTVIKQKTPQRRSFPQPVQKHLLQLADTDIVKDSRRTRILKLIKDNREVTIKDISFYFPELSEKTIQRELVFLVESSVLKKSGERRWSRYSLA